MLFLSLSTSTFKKYEVDQVTHYIAWLKVT